MTYLHSFRTNRTKNKLNILEFNQCRKSDKTPFIFYAGLECLTDTIDACKNNSEKSSSTKLGESCMKKFCETLREYAIKMINFKKEKIQGINKPNSRNHMKWQKSITFPNKKLRINMLKTKNIVDLLRRQI